MHCDLLFLLFLKNIMYILYFSCKYINKKIIFGNNSKIYYK